MRKIDKLVLQVFIGPFILTLAVVVFILLTQNMMHYIDELVGKDLDWIVFAKLIFYFSLIMVPLGLPLAVLLSSLITFGNLGEHNEITAMKGSGISLIRVLRPVFVFTLIVSFASFWFSDNVLPWANLKAFSLLWDVKQKSPSLSLKKGAFYNGLPGYSIKVNEKYPDGKTIQEVMIYNHSQNRGNKELILADSGRMYTIQNERYLVLELFRGKSFHDQTGDYYGDRSNEKFVRNKFNKSQLIFNLSSFDMKRTDESLFAQHKIMHNTSQLRHDIDSLRKLNNNIREKSINYLKPNYFYHLQRTPLNNTTQAVNNPQNPQNTGFVQTTIKQVNPFKPGKKMILNRAATQAKNVLSLTRGQKEQLETVKKETIKYSVEIYKKYTLAFACITMFLIGAPLGAIIKKGGLGIPVLISIIFFIAFYVISVTFEKWVKESYVPIIYGMWASNFILFWFGLFFLRQAKNDSRLLEADVYFVWKDQILEKFRKKA